jgi:hypothetical protein
LPAAPGKRKTRKTPKDTKAKTRRLAPSRAPRARAPHAPARHACVRPGACVRARARTARPTPSGGTDFDAYRDEWPGSWVKNQIAAYRRKWPRSLGEFESPFCEGEFRSREIVLDKTKIPWPYNEEAPSGGLYVF